MLDALVESTMRATPFPETNDPSADFRSHLGAVVRLFRSPAGELIRGFLAEAQGDPTVATAFVERFWEPRRALSRAGLARAIAHGDIDPDVDTEAVLDALYGPLWTQLLVRHQPVTASLADSVLRVVWYGISLPRKRQEASASDSRSP